MKRVDVFMPRLCATLTAVCALSSCAPQPHYTVIFQNAKGIERGADLRQQNLVIGNVSSISSEGDDKNVNVMLFVQPEYRNQVKTDIAFIVHESTNDSDGSYIELVVFDKESPLLPLGSTVVGAESEIAIRIRQAQTSWFKNLVAVAIAVCVLIGLVYCSRAFIRIGGVAVAVAVAFVGAFFYHGVFVALLEPRLPNEYRADIIAFVLLLFALYIASVLLLRMLVSPFRIKKAG